MKCLLIVESPAKAKTIAGYLSERPETWTVRATKGHVADLPRDRIGIHEEQGHYRAEWTVDRDKKALLSELRQLTKSSDRVFIASDDDREGERIAHDVIEYLKLKDYARVTFQEITRQAIEEAINGKMSGLREQRVDAQMARRIVDREIGYPVSQIIRWYFAQNGGSVSPRGVGRVVSPALGILAQTERDIAGFVPETFERIACDYKMAGETVRLMHNKKFAPSEWGERDRILADLRTVPHVVYNYQKQNREIAPYPPFTTARLQRCCFYLFGFEPKYTMSLAQDLYEGMGTSQGRHGLITYPRSDSHNISDHAVAEIISLLSEHIPVDLEESDEVVLKTKRPFKSPSNAQAAHEAIRPTHFSKPFWPRNLTNHISNDHRRLYELIWFRTLATQLRDAVYDASTVEIAVGEHRLSGQANRRIIEGWEYLDGHRAHVSERQDEERHKLREVCLPPMEIGAELEVVEAQAFEMSTRHPPRFGIGRFLTVLDVKGIARPSTLDAIIDNLKFKGYVNVRSGFLYVTETGLQVDTWTSEYAPWLNDTDHARTFEERLDAVESATVDFNLVIREYFDLVNELKTSLGYEDRFSSAPSEAQVEYARSLAVKTGVAFPDDLAMDREGLKRFIEQYRPTRELLGKCPQCRKRTVFAYEKVIACASVDCDFNLFPSQLDRFCTSFSIGLEPMDLANQLFSRKETLIAGMTSAKGRVFDAYVGLGKESGKNWQIKIIRFARGKRAERLSS